MQPITIDGYGGRLPGLLQRPDQSSIGKSRHKLFPGIRQDRLLKVTQQLDVRGIKVTLRHRRVGVSFSFKKSPNVSSIFLQQRLCTILGMTLEMYEQAS